jgi:hypothetical protein
MGTDKVVLNIENMEIVSIFRMVLRIHMKLTNHEGTRRVISDGTTEISVSLLYNRGIVMFCCP